MNLSSSDGAQGVSLPGGIRIRGSWPIWSACSEPPLGELESLVALTWPLHRGGGVPRGPALTLCPALPMSKAETCALPAPQSTHTSDRGREARPQTQRCSGLAESPATSQCLQDAPPSPVVLPAPLGEPDRQSAAVLSPPAELPGLGCPRMFWPQATLRDVPRKDPCSGSPVELMFFPAFHSVLFM